MERSDSIGNLAQALVQAQAEIRNPAFDKTNPHFRNKYVTLAQVRDTVTPVLTKHGLAVTQLLRAADNGVACETVLMHSSGEWISGTFAIPVTKADAQGTASASTYARRYGLMAICNVVGDDDDDGNAAAAAAPAAKTESAKSESSKTVAQVAWEALDRATQESLRDRADEVRAFLADGADDDAWIVYDETTADADERAAFRHLFDSKERSRLKAASERAKKVPA